MNIARAEPHEVYRTHMAEAKLRLRAIERTSNSSAHIAGLPALNAEFCFLQIRRIVELITFSAMVREEGRYSKLREQDRQFNSRDHGNASKDWQAPEILKRLVALSPHILPIPIAKATQQRQGLVHYERHTISVNHGRLIELYEKCGGYMHAKNPLVADYAALAASERAKYEAAPLEISRAFEFLRKLLWQHAAVQLDWSDPENPKELAGPGSAWIIDFGTPSDANITLVVAGAA